MSATSSMIPMYVSNCAMDYGLDGTRELLICSLTMMRVSANAGWRINCQAVLGMHGQCASSEQSFSVFELIWTADELNGSVLQCQFELHFPQKWRHTLSNLL